MAYRVRFVLQGLNARIGFFGGCIFWKLVGLASFFLHFAEFLVPCVLASDNILAATYINKIICSLATHCFASIGIKVSFLPCFHDALTCYQIPLRGRACYYSQGHIVSCSGVKCSFVRAHETSVHK